jgi:Cu2+-containing amine oxidase
MIGKITGGASFGGALEYLTQPKERGREQKEAQEKRESLKATAPETGEHAPPYAEGARHRVIGGNLSGQSREEMAQEFEAIRKQRPDIKKPVHHVSLSAGEQDRVTIRQWQEIAAKYVEGMGFKDAPYVVIQHRDGKTNHIHILTSRVDVRGKVVSEWQSKGRAEKLLREIEREYGLEQVKSSRDVERAAPKRGEIERFNRTGELSTRMSLQSHVELALRNEPTVTEFVDRLHLSGVEAIPYMQKSGRVSGISFVKGSR